MKAQTHLVIEEKWLKLRFHTWLHASLGVLFQAVKRLRWQHHVVLVALQDHSNDQVQNHDRHKQGIRDLSDL